MYVYIFGAVITCMSISPMHEVAADVVGSTRKRNELE